MWKRAISLVRYLVKDEEEGFPAAALIRSARNRFHSECRCRDTRP